MTNVNNYTYIVHKFTTQISMTNIIAISMEFITSADKCSPNDRHAYFSSITSQSCITNSINRNLSNLNSSQFFQSAQNHEILMEALIIKKG